MDRKVVYEFIDGEREYQNRKHGADRPPEVGAWLTIMRKYLNNAETAWVRYGDYEALVELRKVLAVGVACAEQHGMPPRRDSGGNAI